MDNRILIVEDNEMNRMLAEISLSEYQVETQTAENGQVALQLVKDNPEGYFDMIFMDILMPVMNGIEATKGIRSLDRMDTMFVPIIAMTAESDQDEISKYESYGFTDYIEKPMDMDELSRLMEKYL